MENVSDDFLQQKKLENLLPNFAGSSPPISLKTSPTSLWKSLVLTNFDVFDLAPFHWPLWRSTESLETGSRAACDDEEEPLLRMVAG